MNLAWLAAVLQPYDVAPHPNFPDSAYDSSGPARLAAIIIGDSRHSRQMADRAGDLISFVEKCLRTDTIDTGVTKLAEWLAGPRPDDLAQAAALALIASSSASELDDYDHGLQVLDNQLRWTSSIDDPDDGLRRAALLQQKALRLRDAGKAYVPTLLEAAEILANLVVERCNAFPTSPGISWSSRTTVDQIHKSLIHSAASLFPVDASATVKAIGIPTRLDLVREPAPNIITRTARSDASTYSDYVEQVFARQFRNRGKSVGTRPPADLFYSVLALELAGHGLALSGRKDLALFRLVQADSIPTNISDALRLLRHAAAKNELDLTLDKIRAAGPLSALSDDSRQILRTRTTPELLRTVEMRVLHVAADLLAPAEARVALNAIRETLSAGGPADLPDRWELPILRKEVAWAAAVALGNASDGPGEAAELLLKEAQKELQGDQLLDRALRRAVAEIEWTAVAQEIKDSWTEFANAQSEQLPDLAETVLTQLGQPSPTPDPSSPIDVLRHALNAAIRGGSIDPGVVGDGILLIRRELTRIRADAARGHYSFGGVSIAELATGLLVVGATDELWPDLADFILDSAVAREERTPALERLAFSDIELPEEVADRFRQHAQQLLVSTGPIIFGEPTSPEPAALRFLSAHRLVEPGETYGAITILASSSDAESRRQAAETIALLAGIEPRGELLVPALPLASDNNVEVRASAARALALLTRLDEALATVARRRLSDLLREDGVLVPLHVLHSLMRIPENLLAQVRGQVEDLAKHHPARSVRAAARRLLQRD
jgi:hypothetical protein